MFGFDFGFGSNGGCSVEDVGDDERLLFVGIIILSELSFERSGSMSSFKEEEDDSDNVMIVWILLWIFFLGRKTVGNDLCPLPVAKAATVDIGDIGGGMKA